MGGREGEEKCRVLEARERAAVARAVAAEHQATVSAVVPSNEQPKVAPARARSEAARGFIRVVAPAVHALAVYAVVDPRRPLRVREANVAIGTTAAPMATARAPRRTCCCRSGWHRTYRHVGGRGV